MGGMSEGMKVCSGKSSLIGTEACHCCSDSGALYFVRKVGM